MASRELIKAVSEYDKFCLTHKLEENTIHAYMLASQLAIREEKDLDFGLKLTNKINQMINYYIKRETGATRWDLEKYAFKNKTSYSIIDKYYDNLLLEAQNKKVDSAFQYLEKNREPKERFYMPRRKQFVKIGLTSALQGMIDDEYDILCISLPPGTGKTTVEKIFNALVAGWFPNDFSLFYSHSGDITRMYYDGVYDIVTNSEEYTWGNIFPDLEVTSTNAKLEQFNIGKYKPFPSVQCTSVGSKNAGKVRASKFLLVDDMIGGIEEALNPVVLDKLWNKYAVDARQRKTQDTDGHKCKEIHIATRWSVRDVIGRIQKMYEGNKRVKVIAVPDIDPITGQSNFDYEYGGFDVAFFQDQQLLMDEISYQCLYQQKPIEREGLLHPEDKLKRYLELPQREPDEILGQCDTKGKGTDFFVLPCLYRYDDMYYCVDAICNNSTDYEQQYENSANLIVNHKMNNCDFERNSGGDRVALEVNKRVESKGWICNITDTPTETNKEARIFQTASWIQQHIVFKDKSLYSPNSDYGNFMTGLTTYSSTGKNKHDDVPDVLSNFALRVTKTNKKTTVEAVKNPFWR